MPRADDGRGCGAHGSAPSSADERSSSGFRDAGFSAGVSSPGERGPGGHPPADCEGKRGRKADPSLSTLIAPPQRAFRRATPLCGRGARPKSTGRSAQPLMRGCSPWAIPITGGPHAPPPHHGPSQSGEGVGLFNQSLRPGCGPVSPLRAGVATAAGPEREQASARGGGTATGNPSRGAGSPWVPWIKPSASKSVSPYYRVSRENIPDKAARTGPLARPAGTLSAVSPIVPGFYGEPARGEPPAAGQEKLPVRA
jgi:hypothetical protein